MRRTSIQDTCKSETILCRHKFQKIFLELARLFWCKWSLTSPYPEENVLFSFGRRQRLDSILLNWHNLRDFVREILSESS